VTPGDETQPGLIPVVPARLVDTRNGAKDTTIDGLFEGGARLDDGGTFAFDVAGRGGVPDDAESVWLNVTVVGPSAAGHLTVYPCDQERPWASNVNYLFDQTVPNAVFTRIDGDGRVCVHAVAEMDLVVDVNAYAPPGTSVEAIAPARLLDTRGGPRDVTIDGEFEGARRLAGGEAIELDVAGRGGVPVDAGGVFLNVTVIDPATHGYLTVYPCGPERPLTSNVNFSPGETTPRLVFSMLGDRGSVCLFSQSDLDLVVDVGAHVPDDRSVAALVPARLLDTRQGAADETIDGEFQGHGRLAAGDTIELDVIGRAGVPTHAQSVLLNITAVEASAPGHLIVHPCGTQRPWASNGNYAIGSVSPNAVLAMLGEDGRVCLYSLEEVDLVVDISGYTFDPVAFAASSYTQVARSLPNTMSRGFVAV